MELLEMQQRIYLNCPKLGAEPVSAERRSVDSMNCLNSNPEWFTVMNIWHIKAMQPRIPVSIPTGVSKFSRASFKTFGFQESQQLGSLHWSCALWKGSSMSFRWKQNFSRWRNSPMKRTLWNLLYSTHPGVNNWRSFPDTDCMPGRHNSQVRNLGYSRTRKVG